MITVKCTYKAAGIVGVSSQYAFDTVTTDFNGTFQDAIKYFLGHVFNLGFWYDQDGNEREDNMMKCIDVQQL